MEVVFIVVIESNYLIGIIVICSVSWEEGI